jgi:uncharacterized membrane protein (UPF0127 family)
MEEKYYKAINVTTGQIIAQKVKIAQDYKSRSVGLLNRESLGDDEGLLIRPCNSIHTFFMKFPIDVVFLDKIGNVVSVRLRLMPWRMAWAIVRGFMVLELKSGKLNKVAVTAGNAIKIE